MERHHWARISFFIAAFLAMANLHSGDRSSASSYIAAMSILGVMGCSPSQEPASRRSIPERVAESDRWRKPKDDADQ